MSWHPEPPAGRHVWVHGHAEHSPVHPGVVVAWQHTPVHQAAGPGWAALVASVPFDGALLVDWVGAERLVPIRDDRAGERTAARPSGSPCRHAWVDSGAGRWNPSLVLAWRRTAAGSWEAQTAEARRHSVLLTWTAAGRLRPVADDRWEVGP